jgi:hypothetical protein
LFLHLDWEYLIMHLNLLQKLPLSIEHCHTFLCIMVIFILQIRYSCYYRSKIESPIILWMCVCEQVQPNYVGGIQGILSVDGLCT